MIWPLYVERGGELYGFCPAKATWDHFVTQRFRLLTIAAESGAQLFDGGLSDQPDWWVEALGWFLPKYSQAKFMSRVKSVIGDMKPTLAAGGGRNHGRHQR